MKTLTTIKISEISNEELKSKVISRHSKSTYVSAPEKEVIEMSCEFGVIEGIEFVYVPVNKYNEQIFAIIGTDFLYGNEAEEVRKEAIEILNEK